LSDTSFPAMWCFPYRRFTQDTCLLQPVTEPQQPLVEFQYPSEFNLYALAPVSVRRFLLALFPLGIGLQGFHAYKHPGLVRKPPGCLSWVSASFRDTQASSCYCLSVFPKESKQTATSSRKVFFPIAFSPYQAAALLVNFASAHRLRLQVFSTS